MWCGSTSRSPTMAASSAHRKGGSDERGIVDEEDIVGVASC